MKSYPAKLESFQREIVQIEALQKLQNSIETLMILWPVYAMLSILGDLKSYTVSNCHFPPLNTSILAKSSQIQSIFIWIS